MFRHVRQDARHGAMSCLGPSVSAGVRSQCHAIAGDAMPALYPDFPCEVCGNAHTLYYPGIGPIPDLSRPVYFTCTSLPVAMRVMAGDKWKPVREKPEGEVEVYHGDGMGWADS